MPKRNIPYSEPQDYFPDEILKKYGLGKYNEKVNQEAAQREKDNKELREVINDKK